MFAGGELSEIVPVLHTFAEKGVDGEGVYRFSTRASHE